MLDSTPGTHSSTTCTTYKQEQKKQTNMNIHPSFINIHILLSSRSRMSAGLWMESLPAGHMEQAEWHPRHVYHSTTLRQTNHLTHTRQRTIYMLVLNCRKKLKILERPHADSGRTCKLHIEISQNLTHNLLSVRRQH